MCGIAGILCLGQTTASLTRIYRMTEAMRNRGPDDKGWAAFHRDAPEYALFEGDSTPQEDLPSKCQAVCPSRISVPCSEFGF